VPYGAAFFVDWRVNLWVKMYFPLSKAVWRTKYFADICDFVFGSDGFSIHVIELI